MPRVSIGVPVYNGENYLERALGCIQAQTFEDFEVVISDNASTDRTEQICLDHATSDSRLRYFRQPRNVGVPGNFNEVCRRSGGEYFQWLAHDDLCEPTYVSRCIEALDSDHDAILAFSRAASIDHLDRRIKSWPSRSELASADPVRRLSEILVFTEPCVIFGLIRSAELRQTALFGSFWAADFALLAELALRGRFIEIPEELFLLRQHGGRATFTYDWRNPEHLTAHWNPESRRPATAPHWTLLRAQMRQVRRARLRSTERVRCYHELWRCWSMPERRAELARGAWMTTQQVPGIGPFVRRAWDRRTSLHWTRKVRRALRELRRVARDSELVVLVDQASFGEQELDGIRVAPFPELHGRFAGYPPDDDVAIEALERARGRGARFLAVAWPAFWWLTHYARWGEHVRSRFPCLLETEHIVVFDLRPGGGTS
jgi:hypothetical protein